MGQYTVHTHTAVGKFKEKILKIKILKSELFHYITVHIKKLLDQNSTFKSLELKIGEKI